MDGEQWRVVNPIEAVKQEAATNRAERLSEVRAQVERAEKQAPAKALVFSIDEEIALRIARKHAGHAANSKGRTAKVRLSKVGRQLEEVIDAVNILDNSDIRSLRGVKMAHDEEMAAIRGKKKPGIISDDVLEAMPTEELRLLLKKEQGANRALTMLCEELEHNAAENSVETKRLQKAQKVLYDNIMLLICTVIDNVDYK